MKKIIDGITLGFLCGFLANIPKAVVNEVLFRKKIESKRYGEVVSGIFMPKSQALSKKGRMFGVGGDFVTSSILGIPLVYMMTLTGKDNFLLKGLITGVIGLGGFRGLLANIGPGKTYPRDPQTNITFTMNSAMWGIIASTLVVMLGNESLFKPKQAKNIILSQPEYTSENIKPTQTDEVNSSGRFIPATRKRVN